VTDIPIIFSAPMILALLAGRKTQTRRLLYTERKSKDGMVTGATRLIGHPPQTFGRWPNKTPAHYWALSGWERAKPGDRLWVREGLVLGATSNAWKYCADDTLISMTWPDHRVAQMVAWAHHQEREAVPSIHMPRWASRLTLVVTATKIERLQKISEDDARAEGAMFHDGHGVGHSGWRHDYRDVHANARSSFARLWRDLHGKEAWDANPEVVALSFRVYKQNIDAMKEAA
jgi:hypothetical protein